jgi:hypothetical protein
MNPLFFFTPCLRLSWRAGGRCQRLRNQSHRAAVSHGAKYNSFARPNPTEAPRRCTRLGLALHWCALKTSEMRQAGGGVRARERKGAAGDSRDHEIVGVASRARAQGKWGRWRRRQAPTRGGACNVVSAGRAAWVVACRNLGRVQRKNVDDAAKQLPGPACVCAHHPLVWVGHGVRVAVALPVGALRSFRTVACVCVAFFITITRQSPASPPVARVPP